MATRPDPAHLPSPFMDQQGYEDLHRDVMGVDEFGLEDELPPIPIPEGMDELDVYRMLPAAPDFEYGGYLTHDEIRYAKGGEDRVATQGCRICTFLWLRHICASREYGYQHSDARGKSKPL